MNVYTITRYFQADTNEVDSWEVVAKDEKAARRLAAKNAGREGKHVWLDMLRSEVTKISDATGEFASEQVLVRKVHSG